MKVYVVHHFFAHYRGAVLRELGHQLAGQGELVLLEGGGGGAQKGIPKISEKSSKFKPYSKFFLRNKWFGSVLWQSGLVRQVLNASREDVWIFLGDAHYLSTWIASILARARGMRVLFWTHGTRHEIKGIKRLALKAFYAIPDELLLYGVRGKELLRHAGIRRYARVIYNSVDYCEQMNQKDNWNVVRRDGNKILFCARLELRKRADLLIRACAIMMSQNLRFKLVIIGDGQQKSFLQDLVKELGLTECVDFVGPLYEESQLAPYFLSASVFVIPETAGLSVMHAMGYGVPVITVSDPDHQMPETEAIIDGKTGAFFSRDDANSLARTIITWLQDSDAEAASRACIEMIETRYAPGVHARRIRSAIFNETDRELTSL